MINNECEKCSHFTTSHFCNLNDKLLSSLNTQKKHVTFKKNELIFRESEDPQGLFCIMTGLVKLQHLDLDGNEVVLRVHKPGDILGYRALLSQEKYHATAIAHENVESCFIPAETFKSLIVNEPGFAMSLLAQLSRELHSVEDRMSRVINTSATERIAEALLYFKQELPLSKWTRKDIASWVGTTPETVMRTLGQFEDQGFIQQDGRMVNILNPSELAKIANIS